MALAKLWNAVFGKRSEVSANESQAMAPVTDKPLAKATAAISAPAAPASGSPAVRTASASSAVSADAAAPVKLSRKKTKSREPKKTAPVAPVEVEAAPVLRMFRRKNNAWSKLIGTRTVATILDTHVGDGSRAVEILEAIVDSNTPTPKYVAIGLFEMGGEKLTVRQFHQKIRNAGGQPSVIPMSLEEGLRRLSQTIGTVDLILLNGNDESVSSPAVVKLLSRVTASGTLVLSSDANGRWQATGNRERKAA